MSKISRRENDNLNFLQKLDQAEKLSVPAAPVSDGMLSKIEDLYSRMLHEKNDKPLVQNAGLFSFRIREKTAGKLAENNPLAVLTLFADMITHVAEKD